MSKKKWLVLLMALGIAACVTTVAIVIVVGFFFLGNMGVDHRLPVYTLDQTDSTHVGYRRTTIKFDGSVYVNDYDEYALQLRNTEPPTPSAAPRLVMGSSVRFRVRNRRII